MLINGFRDLRRFWLRSFLITAVICIFFACLMLTVDGEGGNEFSTVRLNVLVAIIHSFHAGFVEPIGLPLATGFVAAICLFVCGFFAFGSQSEQPNISSVPPPTDSLLNLVEQHQRAIDDEKHGTRVRKIFGTAPALAERKVAEDLSHKQRWDSQRPQRQLKAGRDAVRALESNGFDWYFAHYGDGMTEDVVAGLRSLGHFELAELTEQAGAIYDESMALVAERDRDMDQQETTAYFARLEPLDRAKWRLYQEGKVI